MIRRAVLCVFVGLLTNVAAAEDRFSLWQVAGESNTVYMLGSVHLLRAEDHPLPASIERAYQDADVIYMEIDMDDLDPLAAQAAINRLGVLKGDETLESILGVEVYAAAQTAADAINIPLNLLQKTEPWLAAMTVEQMSLARIGFNALYGVEMTVLKMAQRDRKPIYGFEELEEQLGFLDTLSIDSQRDMLLQTLQASGQTREMMDALITAWRSGDSAYFERTVLADFQQYPTLYDVIVAERNLRWVEEIDELLDDEQDYLIVVGVLHLVGEDGVPTLLKQRGYGVSQLAQE